MNHAPSYMSNYLATSKGFVCNPETHTFTKNIRYAHNFTSWAEADRIGNMLTKNSKTLRPYYAILSPDSTTKE